jgi:hypothetical protein
MLATMLEYFAAERRESLLFISIGVVAVAAGWTLFRGQSAFRAAAYPLIAIATVQIVVGLAVYMRTDGQVAALSTQLASTPIDFRTDETARMVRVMASLKLYKVIEIVLILAAVTMIGAFRTPSAAFAIGSGLLLQASVMLVADIVAEHRGQLYLDAVARLVTDPWSSSASR